MKYLLGVLLTGSLVGAAASARTPAESPDASARALMAQCRAASGGRALDRHAAFHETGTILRDGKAGTYEMYGDLHALRTAGIHTLDGKVGGGGFDGTAAWRFGADGKVTASTDARENANARSDAYFTIGAFNWPERFPATFRYLGAKRYRSRPYDVVEVTPEGATPADLWLDRNTHRLSRLTITDGRDTASADIWDNRRVDGTLVGFKSHQVEGGHDMLQTLATFDYVPLDPARLAPPVFGK